MNVAKLLMSAAASAGLAATAAGQQFPALIPPTSTVPPPIQTAPPFPNATGIAPQPAVPDGPTIWSKLGISQAQQEYCRRKLCQTPAGQLMGAIRNPISNISGGLIPPFCPITPSLAELQDPGVIGAAAKVKQDRAGAAQRIEAIKLLAGVDCTYWPEAEEALIGALRTDRNECVRYEAAKALARGCCCTNKVIVALSHTVCCSDKDGGFMEKSARVRSAAAVALERCLALNCNCMPELPAAGAVPAAPVGPPPTGGGKPEAPTTPIPENGGGTEAKRDMTTAARFTAPAVAKPAPKMMRDAAEPMTFREYYAAVPRVPRDQVLANARRALDVGRRIGVAVNEEVIPADYSAAGFATPDESKSAAKKPTNLWAMWTKSGNAQPELPTPGGLVPAVAPAPTTVIVKTTAAPAEPPVRAPARAETTVRAPAVRVPVQPTATPVATTVARTVPTPAPKEPVPLPPLKTEARPAAAPAPSAPPQAMPIMPAPFPVAVTMPKPATPAPTVTSPPKPVTPATAAPMPVVTAQVKPVVTPAPVKSASVPVKPAPAPVEPVAAVSQPGVAIIKPVAPPADAKLPPVVPVVPPAASTPAVPAPSTGVPAEPVPLNMPRYAPGVANPYGYGTPQPGWGR